MFVVAAALASCSYLTPYDTVDPSQGPLYQPAGGGFQEALPTSRERRAGPYVVRLALDPPQPRADERVSVAFKVVHDSSGPVRGARLTCKAGMPNIPGHIHNLGIHPEHHETEPGRYEMDPLVFGMGGRWDLVFQALLPDGRQFYGEFPVEVQGPPWPQPPRPTFRR